MVYASKLGVQRDGGKQSPQEQHPTTLEKRGGHAHIFEGINFKQYTSAINEDGGIRPWTHRQDHPLDLHAQHFASIQSTGERGKEG
jgi:hypothetical protein